MQGQAKGFMVNSLYNSFAQNQKVSSVQEHKCTFHPLHKRTKGRKLNEGF